MNNEPLVDAPNEPMGWLNPDTTSSEQLQPVSANTTTENTDISTQTPVWEIPALETPQPPILSDTPKINDISQPTVTVPVNSIKNIQVSAVGNWLSVVIPQIPAFIISFTEVANILKLPEWVVPLLILLGSFVTAGYKLGVDIQNLFKSSL